MNEIASMVIAELKTQDAATAATVKIASLPAASQVGMTAGSESGIVGKLSSIISRCLLPQQMKMKEANDNSN